MRIVGILLAAGRSERFGSDKLLVALPSAFDDIATFNAAMQSPVRLELRQHFHEFPSYSGRNTHFAMDRTRIVG